MPPDKPRILISESTDFSSDALVKLRQLGHVTLADLDRHRLLLKVADADILWVRLRHRIDAEVMKVAPRLKVIVTPTTGLNHIDLGEACRRGVAVLSLRGEADFLRDVRATAEHTVGLILSLLRHVPDAVSHVRSGGWNRDLFKGSELFGKTIGVVGYGRIGQIVARYLRAFDSRVLVTDLEKPDVGFDTSHVRLGQLLDESDLVTLHVNFADETYRFFGEPEFSRMKKGSWFVNTSRGEVVNEKALLESLRSGHLAGAALDVLSDERSEGMGGHALVAYTQEHENLIITPHIGGCTKESMGKTEMFLANKLNAYFASGN